MTTVPLTQLTGRVITATKDYPLARIGFADGAITEITELGPDEADQVQADALPTIVPGFIDLHVHGGGGASLVTGDLDECRRAVDFHRQHGTTTMLASLVSATESAISEQIITLSTLYMEGLLTGIHLEGPFLNPQRAGAHDARGIVEGDPNLLTFFLNLAGGAVKRVTFAPETPKAVELIDVLAQRGILASLGHTEADFATTMSVIESAADKGARLSSTHLLNAMAPINHREPGAVVALLKAAAKDLTVLEVIADGVHLHPEVVDTLVELLPGKLFAATDAMSAAGQPDGDYQLGGVDVAVAGGIARVRPASEEDSEEGWNQDLSPLAGGTSTLADQFRGLQERLGGTQAVQMTSTVAAKALGLDEEIGDLRPGMRADIAVLGAGGGIEAVYVKGAKVTA